VVPLLSAYSGLSMKFQEVISGTTENVTASYTVVYHSHTTFKVQLTESDNGQAIPTSDVYILNNGTAIALDEAGYNFTGSTVSTNVAAIFSAFITEVSFGNQLSTYTASAYFHSIGTTSVTIGTSTFTVTNYVANSLPENLATCGISETLTAYSMSVGIPTGSTYPLVTSMNIAYTTSSGSLDVEITLTSITVA
jgi:hypothetical protein